MGSDGPNWPGSWKGRHRQVVDAIEINAGFPLAFRIHVPDYQSIAGCSDRSRRAAP
jgi:hypothetical protein